MKRLRFIRRLTAFLLVFVMATPSKFPSGGFSYNSGTHTLHGHGANPVAISQFPGSNAASGPTASIRNNATGDVFRANGTLGSFWSNPNGAHIPLVGSPF